jgi:biopolymer transport protein ExbB/TolQ
VILAVDIEQVIFEAATALRVPVMVLAVLALAVVIYELGGVTVELVRRRRSHDVESLADEAAAAFATGDAATGWTALGQIATSSQMQRALNRTIEGLGKADPEERIAKVLADFDVESMRRLERTRMLVRAGPALGLMGTLIPLSPALTGLADGNVDALTSNLRVAFSITVLGLLIGAVAFMIALVRDRIYAQDLTDLEFTVARLESTWRAR